MRWDDGGKNYTWTSGWWREETKLRIKRVRSEGVLRISVSVCVCAVMILPRVNRYQSVYKIETDRYRIYERLFDVRIEWFWWCHYSFISANFVARVRSFVRSFALIAPQFNETKYGSLACALCLCCYIVTWSHLPLLFSLMFRFFSIILIRFYCVCLSVCFVCSFFALALWTHKCGHIIK